VRLAAVAVVVEIPRGSRNKYEYDPRRKRFRLDRVLYASVHYPADYGFVVDTLGDDGDPLDALVVVDEPTFPGCIVEARPIGVLAMRDEKGPDDKLLTVPVGDPRFNQISDVADLPASQLAEIEYFFATYKTLERKLTEMIGWKSWEAADVLIRDARERFRQNPDASGKHG
jgi:inorganic pyrophosphatase